MIFSQRDSAEMRKAADFLWLDDKRFLTYGIVEHIVVEVLCDDLDKIINRIIEGREDDKA